ncbi:hypothetical protein [Empedobacter sp. UBA5987]|uniref:hypothetical protein n=1 Tax=Empedobacter sp. UBA5987 TaxID=1946444 RepID=UPI002581BC34|nr:hypothetical protein [Empedobacter sp. UBA5987]MDM1042293.1 hypothetical protein [Empedobacter brevis]MDM1136223.1 hypothetical protein [Empedobacter sp. R750]
MKIKIINLLCFLIGFIGMVGFIIILNNQTKSKPEYFFDETNLSFEYIDEIRKYNFEKNQFEQYYIEDTIVIKNVLDQKEKEKIISLIRDKNIFRLDSIYQKGHGIIVTLPNLRKNIIISDKTINRHFVLTSAFEENNYLSNKKDYNELINFINELNSILDKNDKIKHLKKTDLEFM